MSEPKCPRRRLILTPEDRADLERIRDRDPRAYRREYAAALLKIAEGKAPYWVARHGLHKPRHPETVYGWLTHYEQTRQLPVRPACRGKGFSPRSAGSGLGDGASVAPASRGGTQSVDTKTAPETLSAAPTAS